MPQQVPSPRRKYDRPRFKRKLHRANINVSAVIDNLVDVEVREVRLVSIDGGSKIKPTILIELPAVGDEEQE